MYADLDTRFTTGGGGSGGSGSRRGGDDPCCPPGYDPEGVWPRNSGIAGAPPDYRSRGAPMESPSPNGGRKKDDFCDCIPFEFGGRWWVLGTIAGDVVTTDAPTTSTRDGAVWVEVNQAGDPIHVPGYGAVEPEPTTTGGGSTGGGSTGGGTMDRTTLYALAGAGALVLLLYMGEG